MRGSARLAVLMAALTVAGCASTPDRPRVAHRPASARATGTLYLANATFGQLTVVDVARGHIQTRQLRELAPGDPPYMIAVVGQKLVVFGHDHTYAFGPALREPARDLGESWFFVPSATQGRVWLALLDPRSPATVNALRAVREVTVNGRLTVQRSRRPPRWPLSALRSGLVLQHTTLELWDPASGRITQRLPGVFPVAARDWRLVSCAARCRVLHISDTRTGARTTIRPGHDFRFVESYDGAFSPDGTLVAVPAIRRHGKPHVALVDPARRTAKLVPGPHLARDYWHGPQAGGCSTTPATGASPPTTPAASPPRSSASTSRHSSTSPPADRTPAPTTQLAGAQRPPRHRTRTDPHRSPGSPTRPPAHTRPKA